MALVPDRFYDFTISLPSTTDFLPLSATRVREEHANRLSFVDVYILLVSRFRSRIDFTTLLTRRSTIRDDDRGRNNQVTPLHQRNHRRARNWTYCRNNCEGKRRSKPVEWAAQTKLRGGWRELHQSRVRVTIAPLNGGDRATCAWECVRSTERRKRGGEVGSRDIRSGDAT